MAWSPDAAPTRANIAKRISAALEALESARLLATRAGVTGPVETGLRNGHGWVESARQALDAQKGKRLGKKK